MPDTATPLPRPLARRPRRWRTLGLAAALTCLALTVAACGTTGADDTDNGGSGADGGAAAGGLAGTSWNLVSYRGTDGTTVDAFAGQTATLSFAADGTFSADTGCNIANGTFESDGTSLRMQVGPTTQRACADDAANRQETTLIAAFGEVDGFAVADNELTLRSGDTTLATYTAGRADVVGRWNVTGLNDGREAVVSSEQTNRLVVEFGADDTVTGSGGCNQLSGGYRTSGADGIAIGPLASTKKACGDGTEALDAQLTAALEASTTWEIRGDSLTLRDDAGAAQLTATAAS
jgi:heat shock protein HslJ